MKKAYEKPAIRCEEFMANEFVAACNGIPVYKFKCTAGGGAHGDVFLDTNGNEILDPSDRNLTRGSGRFYHACLTEHEAPVEDEFPKGFYVKNGGNDQLYRESWWGGRGEAYPVTPVRIWTENGTNVHATEKLEMGTWEVAKS